MADSYVVLASSPWSQQWAGSRHSGAEEYPRGGKNINKPSKGSTRTYHSCPARSPPPLFPLDQTQASSSLKTPPYPRRLYDSQDSLDKLMHFLPQLSDFVPLKSEFYSFRVQTDQHHPVDPGTSYTAVVPRGVADL